MFQGVPHSRIEAQLKSVFFGQVQGGLSNTTRNDINSQRLPVRLAEDQALALILHYEQEDLLENHSNTTHNGIEFRLIPWTICRVSGAWL